MNAQEIKLERARLESRLAELQRICVHPEIEQYEIGHDEWGYYEKMIRCLVCGIEASPYSIEWDKL